MRREARGRSGGVVAAWSCLLLALLLAASSAPRAWGQAPEPAPTRLPDPEYTLEAVELTGDFSTSERIIRDALDLRPGDRVSVASLQEARLRLLATGFFKRAQFGMQPGGTRGHVIVQIDLEDRNTLLLSDVHIGASRRSPFWGGLDVVEGNLLGQGLVGQLAFVAGASQGGVRVRLTDPALGGSLVSLGVDGHVLSGRDRAYRVALDPGGGGDFELEHRRAGGRLSLGLAISELFGLYLDLRVEGLRATSAAPALTDGLILSGDSLLSTARLAVEFDSRDDPVMPRRGWRVHVSGEGSAARLLSDYSYIKLIGQAGGAIELTSGHILRATTSGGAVFGDAPFFERFFIGDISDLVPGRDLGLNFSARAAPDFFNTGADQLSYETLAVRASLEYAIPIVDRLGSFERIEFFFGGGVYGATTPVARRARVVLGLAPEAGARVVFPVDLTVDLGVRVETSIGIFGLSFANALALIPF